MYKSLWYLCATVALSLNYASAFVIIIVWDIHLLYSIPLIFTISFILGALIADMRNSLICGVVCMAVGIAIAAAMISAPPTVYSEGFAEIQTTFALTLNSIIKVLILNITSLIVGVIIGHLLGEQ